MSSTSESGGGSARPSAYHVMEQLKPWDLYSLDGAEQSECLDVMKEYFTRYRMIRGEKTNNAYTHDALQRSWCAFIRRWNAAGHEGLSFTSWLEDREAARSTRSIGDLRTRVCEMAQRVASVLRASGRRLHQVPRSSEADARGVGAPSDELSAERR
ncbi:hypothetical protein PF005_g8973 [Phytophthora fragariae]|uniref:Uncharacterized protein n=1 Tax=Phytophthora fragariae TaxID=53985 RepID=A0A6A3F9A5_9STRA|nr:hypothetical protein PF003_g3052 [Phytophthora fragariae]KAE8940390.1 hypothetical protein PF009_g9801 [Phytophthora fragariae]KAE9014844.1 hypothetical protein PF011_g7879 [Phytophthora fragariae]KAE9097665.1 hypothetical protein PF006_g23520 [Phytophthora fragariae]KAE9111113.1 hypothetical protein PF010_g10927 [Phytophthora fragariae]